ncbi:MAG TPA: GNAT family N-acetyltransferase [Patescibacteria group bacterium]|nr:GNAT family N-acetyltransferase [Patescibacteria group bacterium]
MSECSFSVRFVESEAQIPAALWAACFPPPLEGPWWYQALEGCGVQDQFGFHYGVISQGGREVGIAPTFLMDVPVDVVMPAEILPLFKAVGKVWPAVMFQRSLFIGSPCSDEGAIGLLPGIDRRAALLCVQDAADKLARELGAPMLVWKDFPNSYAEDMAWVSEQRQLFRLTSFPGMVAPVPGGSKDAYFATLKASRRHALKKKLRRSAESADLTSEVIRQPDAATMDEIFALFWQTYERAHTKFETLNRRFFDLIAANPQAVFLVAREKVEGKMVAFMLCFDLGDTLINKFIGMDYAQPKDWMLYFRLWSMALDLAESLGATEIQSGQTGYSPKIEMGHDFVPLTTYCRHRSWLMNKIYAYVAKSVDWSSLDGDLAIFMKAHPEADRAACGPAAQVNG